MPWNKTWLPAVLSAGVVSLVGGPAVAQRSTSTEVRSFEVVSVDGNQVVVKGQQQPSWPLVGLLGAVSVAIGAILRIRRRRSAEE